MKERNKAVAAVYIILEKGGKILFGKRINTGYQDGNYQFPAGHVEEGELPTHAIIREAKEEVNVDLSPADLQLIHVSFRPKHDQTGDRVEFFFKAKTWGGELKNMEPEKCEDLKWIKIDELPENTVFHVKKAMESIQKGEFFNEIPVDVLKKEGLYTL
jgi:8-oxo-dGTP diphosphatase